MLAGDIAFLEMSDLDSLNLPKLAQDKVTTYVEQRLCRPPFVLDLTSIVTDLTVSTEVTCQRLRYLPTSCFMFAQDSRFG